MTNKSQQRKPHLLRWICIVIGILCILCLCLYLGLRNYLSSESLRSNIENNLALATSGEAKLADLDWQKGKVENKKVSVTHAKGALKALQIEQLSAQLTPNSLFLSNTLNLNNIEVQKVDLSIASPDKDYIPYTFPKPQGLSRLLPENVWLAKLDINSLNANLKLDSGVYTFKNLKFTGSQKSSTLYDGILTDGELLLPFSFLPKLELEQSGFSLSKNAVEFYDAEAKIFNDVPATIHLNYDWQQSKLSLRSDIRGLPVSDLIASTSVTGIKGKTNIDLKYKWSEKKGQSYHSTITLSKGIISHPVALSLITQFSNNHESIQLDIATIEVSSTNANQHTIHAYLEQKNRVAIEAHLTITHSEKIKGSILIGFEKSQCLASLEKASPVLQLGKKNLYWREIKIDNTYSELEQLLVSQLISAKMTELLGTTVPVAQDVIKSGGNAVEQSIEAINEVQKNLDLNELPIPIPIPIPDLKKLLPF